MNPIKRNQYVLAGGLGCAGFVLLILLLWSVDDGPKARDEKPKESQIEVAGKRVNAQELWVDHMEVENKLTRQKIEALEKLMRAGSAHEKIKRLEQELEVLRMAQPQPQPSAPASAVSPELAPSLGIKKVTLNLAGLMQKGKKNALPENTLPAGTFARAILLGGVDASTATSAPSDPRPVLLRLTDPGNLPRRFRSDLLGCHVLASSYGDLSSERVYMRLEKLTCTERLTGEISETQVAGYVVGEDGKAGVRGVVVDKAGPIIRNSLIGGFFSGMGKFFESQQSAFVPIVGANPLAGSLNVQQVLRASASQGTSQPDKYAEFFIKRAEQLQPILQVAAGREVDIVITQGTPFGETSVRNKLSQIRRRAGSKALSKMEVP